MSVLYNEFEPYAALWLDNLVAAGHIAKGDVDARSIADLRAADLVGRAQCHFFAGIGVWSYALRLAGWPDDREVWTGSCPCQPFSAAGKGGGFDDERHLWPTWFALIRECRPSVVFGEQVASPDGLEWLDLVHADLEGAGYAVGVADLCAAGVGAPHIRQRLYFVAYAEEVGGLGAVIDGANADGERFEGERVQLRERRSQQGVPEARRRSTARQLGDASGEGSGRNAGTVSRAQREGTSEGSEPRRVAHESVNAGENELADAEAERRGARRSGVEGAGQEFVGRTEQPDRLGATRGFWSAADWIACTDGVSRPVEPGTFPLAHGATARVGRLRAYGNAINAEVAATFIRAAMEAV